VDCEELLLHQETHKEIKKRGLRGGSRIEEMMKRFLEKREEETALMVKQAEEEAAR